MKIKWDVVATIIGCIGVPTTGILACRSQMKVDEILFNKPEEEPVNKKEIVKQYLPAVISGAVTIGAIIFAEAKNSSEKKFLSKALLASEAGFGAYRNYISGQSTQLDNEAMACAEKAKSGIMSDAEYAQVRKFTEMTIYEPITKEFINIPEADFYHSLLDINRTFAETAYVSLDAWIMKLKGVHIPGADEVGWDADIVWNTTGEYTLDFCLIPDVVNGIECYRIEYNHDPSTLDYENTQTNYGLYHCAMAKEDER